MRQPIYKLKDSIKIKNKKYKIICIVYNGDEIYYELDNKTYIKEDELSSLDKLN